MKHKPAIEAPGLRFDRLAPVGYVALALALVALWLFGRRYGGITHDASVYIVQGLRVLDPASFAKDLFFAHGAQDAYTIFPRIYALLIANYGAGNAALIVTVAGQLAFFAAATALVFRISTGQLRWWSLALLAMFSGYYGGVGVFRFAESFATARSLAEPLVVGALACTLLSRHVVAAVLLAAAVVLHPLVAAPGVAVVYVWHTLQWRRLLWLIPILILIGAAVAVAWPEALVRFDPPWLTAVAERLPHLFLSRWELADWSRILWGLIVACVAVRFVAAPARRLVFAVVAVGLAGLAASWIAVDLLGIALAAGLQPWRAHWLLHFLAIALAPVAVAGLWRSGNAARAAAACIAASCCFGRAELPASAVLAALAVALDASERRWPGWLGERAFRLTLLAVLCAAAAGLLLEVQSRLPFVYGAMPSPAWTDYVHAGASVGGMLPLAVLTWVAAYSRFAIAALALAVVSFAVGITTWDARAPWSRYVEQASGGMNPFREKLTPHAVVFWPGPYGKVWVALGKPAWFSTDQGAGIVFNRETAIEYAERKLASSDLRSAIENCAMAAQPACRIDARPVSELCKRQDGPDYVVLNARVGGYAAIEWPLPPDIGPGRQSLFLYSCRAFAGNEKASPKAGLLLLREA